MYDVNYEEEEKMKQLFENVDEMGKHLNQLNNKELTKYTRLMEKNKIMKLSKKRHERENILVKARDIFKKLTLETLYNNQDDLIRHQSFCRPSL